MLIFNAQADHEAYVNQTSASKTLAQAVKNYRERYNTHPPPGFDRWYKYATERDSVVIDDFDSIYQDLLPFYAVSPQFIRHRTWQMASNRWHDAHGLIIRNGKVAISDNVPGTHRWMLDGVANVIGHFAEHLPDMDLAFNANDEPRIAMGFEEIEEMRRVGRVTGTLGKKPENAFSVGRANQWRPIPMNNTLERVMKDWAYQRIFHNFGSIGCPPGSPARDQRLWNTGELCASCAEPHSMGAFLANWSKAADICHQPDMATLHGLYSAPASFKATHDLFPIFSQSKAHGFNDILYPSAWNYNDKARYDPNDEHPDVPYADKNRAVYWRGMTSEGLSAGKGQWKGMSRQRFLHMMNDINGTGAPQSILLPYDASGMHPRLEYTSVSPADLTSMMQTDAHFVEKVIRCIHSDCPNQEAEFAPMVQRSDFQAHWSDKYLLDLDGAGFSGRFIPFLQSHSLPLKAALFREWWDDRLTAWHHFVPLDLRGQGFWATLAYFAGMEGTVNGRHVKLEPHDAEGEAIAENGREWANKVLRKEDMEIYMFRLLLEWGRLTDDRRDSIGLDIDAG